MPPVVLIPASSLSAEKKRQGFALLITITLLAFLVLLLISLASLTRVETQVADNSQKIAQARQNALMALNIALAQLQKYTGPDQRVTATADIAGTSDGDSLLDNGNAANTQSLSAPDGSRPARTNGLALTASIQRGTRYWTGVWGNADAPHDLYKQSPAPVLLNWLVSGNENAPAFTSDASGNGRITSESITAPFRPSMQINGLAPSSTAATALTINNGTTIVPAALLVGPGTAAAANSPDSTDVSRYIAAPLVQITAAPGSLPGFDSTATPSIGRYAWWVGDEGVKARHNLSDAYVTNTDIIAEKEARYRLLTAQRNGIELVTGFSNYPANSVSIGRVQDRAQFNLADTTLSAAQTRPRFHDLTTYASGVLADSLNGGLRRDLTRYLEPQGALEFANDLSGAGIISAPYGPNRNGGSDLPAPPSWAISSPVPTAGAAPSWDLIKSHYQISDEIGSTAEVTARPATRTQTCIAPVISEIRMLFGMQVVDTTTVRGTFRPLVVLANPYTVRLRVPATKLRFASTPAQRWGAPRFGLGSPIEGGGKLQVRSRHSPSGNIPLFYYFTGHNPDVASTSPSQGILDDIDFSLPAHTLLPGEAKTFSLGGIVNAPANPVPMIETDALSLGSDYYYRSAPLKSVARTPETFETRVDATTLPITIAPPYPTPIPANQTRTGDAFYMLEEGNISSPINITLSQNGSVLKELQGVDLDRNYSSGFAIRVYQDSAHAAPPFPLGLYQLRLAYPGNNDALSESAPDRERANFNRTLRVFSDFNLQATTYRLTTHFFSTPPYQFGYFGSNGSLLSNFTDNLAGSTYWGYDSAGNNGDIESVQLYDLPRRAQPTELPIFSIAQLQHANLTADDHHENIGHQPAYAVGNSFATPYVRRDLAKQTRSEIFSVNGDSATPAPGYEPKSRNYYDLSYLLNVSLWDRYFFSTIAQDSAAEPIPANRRLVFDAEPSASVRNARRAAENLTIAGAFNINSTSVEAWKAVLSGTRGLAMPAETLPEAAFPRTIRQPSAASLPLASGNDNDSYAGYRRLTSDQIELLAREVVKQVRLRGPFLNLAQFVNRDLVSVANDSTSPRRARGLDGALQAAIQLAGDSNSNRLGLNTHSDTRFPTHDRIDAYRQVERVESGANTASRTGDNARGVFRQYADSSLSNPDDTTALTGTTVASDSPRGKERGYRSTAAPGWLTQADLLQVIGPVLAARSDTFVIRTYGEVLDPINSTPSTPIVLGRAWCEAIVQRTPEYIDQTDANLTPALANATPPSAVGATNQTFGRRYQIVSFRWLNPEDI